MQQPSLVFCNISLCHTTHQHSCAVSPRACWIALICSRVTVALNSYISFFFFSFFFFEHNADYILKWLTEGASSLVSFLTGCKVSSTVKKIIFICPWRCVLPSKVKEKNKNEQKIRGRATENQRLFFNSSDVVMSLYSSPRYQWLDFSFFSPLFLISSGSFCFLAPISLWHKWFPAQLIDCMFYFTYFALVSSFSSHKILRQLYKTLHIRTHNWNAAASVVEHQNMYYWSADRRM